MGSEVADEDNVRPTDSTLGGAGKAMQGRHVGNKRDIKCLPLDLLYFRERKLEVRCSITMKMIWKNVGAIMQPCLSVIFLLFPRGRLEVYNPILITSIPELIIFIIFLPHQANVCR